MSVKVMLVDDEVMALNNLRHLINWERSGCKIIAAETNPRKALEIFKELKPRIVIVDIKMPVMNGLELSREILSLNIPVKIIVLTSYKDFQYAKKAIEVGIANYLVKHELNEETLVLELNRLKKELVEDEKKEEIIRHRLLRSLVDNTISEKVIERVYNKYFDSEIGKLMFLFFKIDTPYVLPEDPESFKVMSFNHLTDVIKGCGIEIVSDIFGLDIGEAAVVIYLEKNLSREIIEKIVSRVFNKVQARLAIHGESVSVNPIITGNNIAEIRGIYSSVKKIFKYSIFWGRGQIISSEKVALQDTENPERAVEHIRDFESLLANLDSKGSLLCLEKLFRHIIVPPLDPVWLKKITTELIRIIDDFLVRNHLPSYKDIISSNLLDLEKDNLFTVSEILRWFKVFSGYAIAKAKENRTKKYSPKVDFALEFIHKNYNEDWAIDDISNKLNISEVYLRKIFKSETGLTIINYLTDIRMKKAINLLDTGNYRIFEIAEMVGYNTSQYFSKAFKKYTGKSPVDYISGR